MSDLKSTFSNYDTVTQITVFKGGIKSTHNNLDTKTIKEGKYTKIRCKKGYWLSINSDNVLYFETHSEDGNTPKLPKENTTVNRPPSGNSKPIGGKQQR